MKISYIEFKKMYFVDLLVENGKQLGVNSLKMITCMKVNDEADTMKRIFKGLSEKIIYLFPSNSTTCKTFVLQLKHAKTSFPMRIIFQMLLGIY